MPIEPPKDDPSIRNRARPPDIGRTLDNEHILRTVQAMNERGIHLGRIRDSHKQFMVLAWMAETNLPVSDCILVQEQLDANRTVFFFAEKLPRDERFAKRYEAMQKEHSTMKDTLCQALNEIATLKTEIANLRGETE